MESGDRCHPVFVLWLRCERCGEAWVESGDRCHVNNTLMLKADSLLPKYFSIMSQTKCFNKEFYQKLETNFDALTSKSHNFIIHAESYMWNPNNNLPKYLCQWATPHSFKLEWFGISCTEQGCNRLTDAEQLLEQLRNTFCKHFQLIILICSYLDLFEHFYLTIVWRIV